MHIFRLVFLATLIAMFVAPRRSGAQSLGAGVTWMQSSHDLVRGGPGLDVAFSIPLPGRTALVLGGIATRHDFRGRDRVCAGLTPPGVPCLEEPTRHHGSLTFARAALDLPVMRWASGHLALAPEFLVGRASASFRGEDSGKSLADDAKWMGAGLSAVLHHRPRPAAPYEIVLGAGGVATWTPGATVMIDGYEPLDEKATLYRVTLGIAVDLGRLRTPRAR